LLECRIADAKPFGGGADGKWSHRSLPQNVANRIQYRFESY
jgi:hypothetical protein